MLNMKAKSVVFLGCFLGCGTGLDQSKKESLVVVPPQYEVCRYDHPTNTFTCRVGKESEYSFSVEQGTYLKCMSESNAADYFNSCKKGECIRVPLCKMKRYQFECKNEKEERWNVALHMADQYLCMGDNSRERFEDQCRKSAKSVP